MKNTKQNPKNQEFLTDYFEQMAQEASLLHPELEHLSADERQVFLDQLYREDETRRAKRLKEHLEVFSDAVIGVIIAMMLLEIPLPSDTVDIHHFFTGILIFFVSFFIVADFWYDNHKILGQIEHATSKILIVQFNFMATLALIPLFTRWMMEGITTTAVVGYGVVTIAVNLCQSILNYCVLQEKFAGTTYTKRFVSMAHLRQLVTVALFNIVVILFAYFNPTLAFYFYILRQIVSFLGAAFFEKKRQERKEKMAVRVNHI
ncbi:TPA: TMEM175 family protein [Streptococcus suis]